MESVKGFQSNRLSYDAILSTPVKESKLDKISRYATIIIAETLFFTCIAAGIGVACSNPVSGTVLLISSIALGIILLKEFAPKLISLLPEKAQKIAHWVLGSINELGAVLLSAAIYPFAAINFDPKELPPETKKVTILVHGFLHNSSGWFYLRHRLNEENLGPVFTVNLGSPFHSIEEYSEVLKKRVHQIKNMIGENANLEIDLIGHSMGGVVSTHFAINNQDESIQVKRVITKGSPINKKGTPIGFLGIGCPCAKQMHKGSAFLDTFEAQAANVRAMKGTKFYHFGYGADAVVPAGSTKFEGNFSKTYPHLGHLSGMYSKDNADDIVRILKQKNSII